MATFGFKERLFSPPRQLSQPSQGDEYQDGVSGGVSIIACNLLCVEAQATNPGMAAYKCDVLCGIQKAGI